jgi:beta-phosphoglucomutase
VVIKAVIFDFDGTLVDLFEEHLEAFQEVIKRRFGMEFTRDDLDAGYGMVGRDILRLFFRKHNMDVGDDVIEGIARERRSLALDNIGSNMKLLPGAERLLKGLKKAGLKVAVATSCSKRVCESVFNMPPFRGLLDAATMGSEVKEGKPDPEIFLKTAVKLGVKPDECLVFEDSAYGVKAGVSAGMKVVAVATGHETREKLLMENPDRVLKSLVEFRMGDLDSFSGF